MKSKKVISIIGCGNMGTSILEGIHKTHKVVVCESDAKRSALLRRKYNVATCGLADTINQSDVVLLAVKPQMFPELLAEIKKIGVNGKLFVSIAAGITTSYIEKILKGNVAVVRTMPNLPAQVKLGITGICAGKKAKNSDLKIVKEIFNAVGECLIVDENKIDAVTAVSGSGPAYVFLFVECMMKAAKSLGFDNKASKALVENTLKGSLALLENSKEDASVLRQKVTSKGGTTQAALSVFNKAKIEKTFKNALSAAKKRAKELSRR